MHCIGFLNYVKDLYMSITTVKVFWDMGSISIKIIFEWSNESDWAISGERLFQSLLESLLSDV